MSISTDNARRKRRRARRKARIQELRSRGPRYRSRWVGKMLHHMQRKMAQPRPILKLQVKLKASVEALISGTLKASEAFHDFTDAVKPLIPELQERSAAIARQETRQAFRTPPDLMIAMNLEMYRLSLERLGKRRDEIRYVHSLHELRGMRGGRLWLGIGWGSSEIWRDLPRMALGELRDAYGLSLAWVPED